MKHNIYQWVTYDEETERCTKHPWYIASGWFGGKLVSDLMIRAVGDRVPSYLGIAYQDWTMAALVMYPRPLHLIVRWWHTVGQWCWKFIQFWYWVGVIDTELGVMFRWSDFWRVRSGR